MGMEQEHESLSEVFTSSDFFLISLLRFRQSGLIGFLSLPNFKHVATDRLIVMACVWFSAMGAHKGCQKDVGWYFVCCRCGRTIRLVGAGRKRGGSGDDFRVWDGF